MATRLAILADYPEENWPSMDLTARMLLEELAAHHADRFAARNICPPFRRYLGWLAPHSGSLRNADRLLNRQRAYPRVARKVAHDFDLFHVCDHSYAQLVHALPPQRTGVFCHDLDTFRCLLEPAAERRPRWFKRIVRRTLGGLQKAAVVFYTTEAVRKQIQRHGLIELNRLVKTPLGVGPEFTPGPADLGPPFLLHVGSCIPRKRIDVLLNVFAEVRRSWAELRLVQVGGTWTSEQQRQIEILGIQPAIKQMRGVDRAMLVQLYRSAAIVLVTSDAEGFGLPVIEALACGATVAASDLPVLREVGGEAVAYCKVAEVDQWARVVGELLKNPDKASQHGRVAQARKYSWQEYGRVIADAYERVLKG